MVEEQATVEVRTRPGLAPGIVGVVVVLAVIAGVVRTGLDRLERQERASVGEALRTVVLTSQAALHAWFDFERSDVEHIAADPAVVALAGRLLASPHDRAALLASPAQSELQQAWWTRSAEGGHLGFDLISPDMMTLASDRDDTVGRRHRIAVRQPVTFREVVAGRSALLFPVPYDEAPNVAQEAGADGEEARSILAIAVPVRDPEGTVLAVLSLRYDAAEILARILRVGRQGETGETYAFDHTGRLLSESRFVGQLVYAGLLPEGRGSRPSIRLADPGADLLAGQRPTLPREDQPLTRMAAAATAGKSGVDVDGYRDYRGRRVLGAWIWDSELALGLTTEIDESEALAPYRRTRDLALTVLAMVAALCTGLVGWVVVGGKRIHRDLRQARDDWEGVAKERTDHLDKARRAALSLMQDANAERERTRSAYEQLTRSQEALSRERRQLQAILDGAPSAVAITRDDVVRYANPKLKENLGLRVGDDPRRGYADLADREWMLAELAAGRAVHNLELRAHGANGEIVDLLASFSPIEHEGEPSILAWLVDVTKLKHAERQLRTAKEDAEAATRAKSLFLANMSHEIRTPMNAILGYAQLLQRDGSLDEAQKRQLEIIQHSANHLLTLINDILEMSRIEAGRTTLVVEPFDLHTLLWDVELMFRGLAATKGLELELELEPDLPRSIEGDAGKVRQVVINLLSNAVKFTDAGRVRIRASSRPLDEQRIEVTVCVEDTGCGIPSESFDPIFDPFDQSATGAHSGGTGLGLAISRNFAWLMQGDLTVESTVGRGSIFSFTFEAVEAPAAALPAAASEATSRPIGIEAGPEPPKVLIVDDSATGRQLLVELLSKIGFGTRVAASGEEAIEVHDAWHPDLVLMDLRMPGMGGLEAIRRLRAQGSRAAIFAISASVLSGETSEVVKSCADGFLRKPYQESDLLARIGQALDVRYIYETPEHRTPPNEAEPTTAAPALSHMVAELPAELVDRLRHAAIQARARYLGELAEQVAEHSQAAADQIRLLAGSFQYEALLAALEPRTSR